MGASVLLSKESPITNALWVFLDTFILKGLGVWIDFAWLDSPWSCLLCMCSSISSPRASYVLHRGTLGKRRGKFLPSSPSRDKGPVSFSYWVTCYSHLEAEFRLSFPSHSLKAGLLLSLGQCPTPCINFPPTFLILHCLTELLLCHRYIIEEFF